MEKETKQGVSGGIVFLIVILCLLLGLASGYILHDKLSNKDITKKDNKKSENKVAKDRTLDLSKECNISQSCGNWEYITDQFESNKDINIIKADKFTYKKINEDTIEVETENKSPSKEGTFLGGSLIRNHTDYSYWLDKECINQDNNCTEEYTLNNGSKKVIVKTEVKVDNQNIIKNIYIDNKLLLSLENSIDNNHFSRIKSIIMLKNNLIKVNYDYYHGTGGAEGNIVTYYQEDLSNLLKIDSRGYSPIIEEGINIDLDKERIIFLKERGCGEETYQSGDVTYSKRKYNMQMITITSPYTYQIKKITDVEGICAGQS